MASQAPRRRESRPASPETQRSAAQQESSQSNAHSPALTPTSESQSSSFVLNSPHKLASSPQSQELPTIPPAPPQPTEVCWICQQDASDDTPESSAWRRPCPCSLTAHEECLLEWITSQEAPKPGEVALSQRIVCPQCKAPINIERPLDLLVITTDIIRRVGRILVVPTALSALIGCFYSGFLVYGFNTMDLIFGHVEARRMLMPSALDLRARYMAENSGFWKSILRFFKLSEPFMPMMSGLKLCLGLPLIAPGLVLARTRLADQIFAILPISYFVFNPTRRLDLSWPPSPALTLAVLPYIRTTYNELYRHTFSDLEKQWDVAVQRKPREGETAEQIAAERQEQRDEGGFFDIEVELVEEGEDAPDDIPQDGNAAGIRPEEAANLAGEGLVAAAQGRRDQLRHQMDAGVPLNEADVQRLEEAVRGAQQEVDAIRERLDEAVAQPPPPAGNRRAQRNNNGWEIRQNVSTAQVARTVMGALFFPAISSLMGDLLKVALPTKWVTKQPSRWGVKVPDGMLKEKWGRSIIGGCLFVVLKDAVTLYCKWKKARDFGKKKVLDYVGERRHA